MKNYFDHLRNKIRDYLARRMRVPEIPFALENLAKLGFNPKQIFDVGAYQGDYAKLCHKIWPEARIACFEVLPHKVNELKELSLKGNYSSVYPILLGAQSCTRIPFNECETASSIYEEHIHQGFPVNYYPMETIDAIIRTDFKNMPPELLKIDVQGYELEVLKGAQEALSKMEVVLLEVNLLDIHKGCPLLDEIVKWFGKYNWVAYDICGLGRRPLDQALWQADMIFVPRNSCFRTDKRWGTLKSES